MVGEIILLVLMALLLIGMFLILVVDESQWSRGDSIAWGVFAMIISLVLIVGTCNTIDELHPNKYLNKYQNKMENIEKCQIDTTYTITGKQVDTTYTIYYTTKKEK